MKVSSFNELEIWMDSQKLAKRIYALFRDCRDYSFKNQICSAAVSISNNIAEGFERHSNREFIRFLFIAKGSCGEVRSMLHLAQDIFSFGRDQVKRLLELCDKISRQIMTLIKVLRARI